MSYRSNRKTKRSSRNSLMAQSKRITSVKSKSYARETTERRLGQYVRSAVFIFLLSYITSIALSQEKVFDPVKIFKEVFIKYGKILKSTAIGSIIRNLLYVLFFGYIFKSPVEKFMHEKIYQRILNILNSAAIITAIVETAYLMYMSKYNITKYESIQSYAKMIITYIMYNQGGGTKTFNEFKNTYINFDTRKKDFISRKLMIEEDFENCVKFKKTYYNLMKQYHPDKCKTNLEECRKITESLSYFKEVLRCY